MNERLTKIITNPKRVPVSIGIVALGVGIGIGYILGKRKEKKVIHFTRNASFNKVFSEEDLAELREDVERQNLEAALSPYLSEEEQELLNDKTTEFIRQQLELATSENEIEVQDESIESVEEIQLLHENVFSGNDDEWNYEKEKAGRTRGRPYVIHKDEFYSNEEDYTQHTLTYYAGDDILADENDHPVMNPASIVGPYLFGHGTAGDQNVFHVRNNKFKAEYEIVRSEGLFSVEVAGLEIENNVRLKDQRRSTERKVREE